MKLSSMLFLVCLGLGVAYLSVSREPQIPQDQNTTNEKGVSFLQKVNSFIGSTFSKDSDEIEHIKEEITVREHVLKEIDRDIQGVIDQANNVKPLCSNGSVSVGALDDPRPKIKEEIAELKQKLASLEK
ncbi:MAG: hypothetical protein V2B20_27615 [Pseudomonadota bacterium]